MGSHYLCGRTALGDFTHEFITKKWESVVWQQNKWKILWDVLSQNDAGLRTQEINYSGRHNTTDRSRIHYPGLKNRTKNRYWLLERNWGRGERGIRILGKKTPKQLRKIWSWFSLCVKAKTQRIRGKTELLMQKKKNKLWSFSVVLNSRPKITEEFSETAWAMLCFTKVCTTFCSSCIWLSSSGDKIMNQKLQYSWNEILLWTTLLSELIIHSACNIALL